MAKSSVSNVYSYLLRLSAAHQRRLEFICKVSGKEIAEALRDLIEQEAERLEQEATK